MNVFKLPPATVRGNAHLKLKAKLLSTVMFPGTGPLNTHIALMSDRADLAF